MPAMRSLRAVRLFASSDETYKSITYVQTEVERLAEQVVAAGQP